MPAFVAGGDVGAEVPVVVFDDGVEQGVDLCGERAREQTLHGQRGLILLLRGGGIVLTTVVETADGKEVEHLLVHLLLTIDDGAYHLLLVGIDGGHLEVEVHLWLLGTSGDVHQTVDADGVRGKGVADAEVGEADAADDVLRLQIEGCLIRIAAEDDGAAGVEGKVLLDDVLDGDAVSAVVDGIGAEHVEGSFIIKGGADGAVAVEVDIVVGIGIHQEAQGSGGRAVDEEVDVDVGGDVRLLLSVGELRVLGRAKRQSRAESGELRVCQCGAGSPQDELLAGDGIGRGGVVDEEGVFLRGDVDVDGDLARTALDADIAGSKDGAVEVGVAEVLEIVGQQVVGIDEEVEGELGEVFVVDAAAERGMVSVAVGEGQSAQFYLVGDEDDGVAVHLIGGVEGRDGGLALYGQLASEVHLIEGARKQQTAVGMTGDARQERVSEVMHEIDVGLVGVDVEGDGVVRGRDEAVDVGIDAGTVVGLGVDVDLLLAVVPEHEGVERSHASALELEVVYVERGVGVGLVEERLDDGLARGSAAELYGIELHEVEDIGHLHFVEVDGERVVVVVLAGASVGEGSCWHSRRW